MRGLGQLARLFGLFCFLGEPGLFGTLGLGNATLFFALAGFGQLAGLLGFFALLGEARFLGALAFGDLALLFALADLGQLTRIPDLANT